MAEYSCPMPIRDKYDSGDERLMSEARAEAMEWVRGLNLVAGDRVWLPGHGWMVKDAPATS